MELTITAFNNRGGSNSVCSFGYLTNQKKIFSFNSDYENKTKFNFFDVKNSLLNENYNAIFFDCIGNDLNCEIVFKLKNMKYPLDTSSSFNYMYLISDIEILTIVLH